MSSVYDWIPLLQLGLKSQDMIQYYIYDHIMIRPTIEETWTLLFMALATLLIVTTGNIVTITAATADVTTKTQLKTYTDPAGLFT